MTLFYYYHSDYCYYCILFLGGQGTIGRGTFFSPQVLTNASNPKKLRLLSWLTSGKDKKSLEHTEREVWGGQKGEEKESILVYGYWYSHPTVYRGRSTFNIIPFFYDNKLGQNTQDESLPSRLRKKIGRNKKQQRSENEIILVTKKELNSGLNLPPPKRQRRKWEVSPIRVFFFVGSKPILLVLSMDVRLSVSRSTFWCALRTIEEFLVFLSTLGLPNLVNI